MPERIQRKRTRGWKTPPNTVYVGRPGKFGNPFVIGEKVWLKIKNVKGSLIVEVRDQVHAAQLFDDWMLGSFITKFTARRNKIISELETLRGKNLSCWCAEGKPCHADTLLRLANAKGR